MQDLWNNFSWQSFFCMCVKHLSDNWITDNSLPLLLIWKMLEDVSWKISCTSDGLAWVAEKHSHYEQQHIHEQKHLSESISFQSLSTLKPCHCLYSAKCCYTSPSCYPKEDLSQRWLVVAKFLECTGYEGHYGLCIKRNVNNITLLVLLNKKSCSPFTQ